MTMLLTMFSAVSHSYGDVGTDASLKVVASLLI